MSFASVVVVVGSGISIFSAFPKRGLKIHKNCAVRREVFCWKKIKKILVRILSYEKGCIATDCFKLLKASELSF